MASPSVPSTPGASPAPEIQTPGKWRHPRLNEIVRRQNAAIFDDRNIKKILCNGGALAATWFFGGIFKSYALKLQRLVQFQTYPDLLLLIIRLFFLMNIFIALYPLFRPKDDLSDIPLTPSQRALLGLDPTVTPPATPGTQYITPPRYRLSSASRQASPASRGTSPLPASGPLSSGRRASMGASFSPSASPLFQKAVTSGNRESVRRQSFGSPSPLSSSSPFRDSLSSSIGRGPASPSPVGSKRSSLGLSNKWLYEKNSRRLSGNAVF